MRPSAEVRRRRDGQANFLERFAYGCVLDGRAWLDLPGDVTASGPSASTTDPDAVTTNRFYRVRVLP